MKKEEKKINSICADFESTIGGDIMSIDYYWDKDLKDEAFVIKGCLKNGRDLTFEITEKNLKNC